MAEELARANHRDVTWGARHRFLQKGSVFYAAVAFRRNLAFFAPDPSLQRTPWSRLRPELEQLERVL
jgi:hypothetical protein